MITTRRLPLRKATFKYWMPREKEIIWFEESAHYMNVSDSDRFQHTLINKIIPKTQPIAAQR